MVTTFRRRKIKDMKWFACTIAGAELLSKKQLANSDINVLFYLLNKIDEDNTVFVENNKKIAESIGISESSVKKSMMILRNEDLIIKDKDERKTIFINPYYFYAGDYQLNEEKQKFFNECRQIYVKKHTERKEKLKNTISKNKQNEEIDIESLLTD